MCEGIPNFASFTVNAGLTTNVAYQWQVNMNDTKGFNNIGMDSAGIYFGSGTASLLLTNPESRFNGYQYRVLVLGACTPMRTSNTATLTVNELP